MTKFIKKMESLWNDGRSEFSREVSQKEKEAIFAEIAKNEQIEMYNIL